MNLKSTLMQSWKIFPLIAILAASLGIDKPCYASAPVVASDGAVAENGAWEKGKSSIWRIEEQQYCDEVIQDGVATENDAEIQQGLLIMQWGFNQQTPDGGFDGTAGGTISGEFHSTSLFIEAAAHAMLALQSYTPVTYTPTESYPNIVVSYGKKLHAACLWLNNPIVAAAGQAGDINFTHRRYLLAGALGETGALVNDSWLLSAAQTYCNNGIALQLGTGWTAAMYGEDSNGIYPVSTLLAPGDSKPDGTVSTISAVGVDPENDGFDVNYQCAGMYFAEHYYPYAPSSQQKQLQTVFNKALGWESSRIDSNGNLDWYGSSRVGVELNNSGQIKTPDMTEIIPAFSNGSGILNIPGYQIVANRLCGWADPVDGVPVSSDGAAGNNVAYESNGSLGWSIMQQTEGIKYIQEGMLIEHDDLIQEGIKILKWGLARESSNGCFTGSGNLYLSSAQFIECVDQASLELASYSPSTYTPKTNYASLAASWNAQMVYAANYLAQSSLSGELIKGIGAHTSRSYMVAACLEETGAINGRSSLVSDAIPYLNLGLSMQEGDGVNPESGAFDANYQTMGILYAERCYPSIVSTTLKSQIMQMTTRGLDYEANLIDVNGNVQSDSSASSTVITSFQVAEQLTSSPLYAVMVARLNDALYGTPIQGT